MLRIDPLTENKTVDMDFFGKEEYQKHKQVVEKYLKDEGFDTLELEEEITICILERWWSIKKTVG